MSEHAERYAEKAGCTLTEFKRRIRDLRKVVTPIPEAELLAHVGDPLVQECLRLDPDAAAYMACLCAVDAHFLWTNDDALWRHFRSVCVRLVRDSMP